MDAVALIMKRRIEWISLNPITMVYTSNVFPAPKSKKHMRGPSSRMTNANEKTSQSLGPPRSNRLTARAIMGTILASEINLCRGDDSTNDRSVRIPRRNRKQCSSGGHDQPLDWEPIHAAMSSQRIPKISYHVKWFFLRYA